MTKPDSVVQPKQAAQIRVVLVDDHYLVREGLRTVLADEPDIHVVGEGASAEEACRLVLEQKPEVVLLDLTLPDANGLELLPRLRQLNPDLRIIVLTIHDSEIYMMEALSAGVSGYLLKDSAPRLIPLAIRSVVSTACMLESRVMERLLRTFSMRRPAPEASQSSFARSLSQREVDILRFISQGCSNREIGERLHLAEATVKKYVHTLKGKLSVNDRAQAAVMGMRLGIVE